MVERSSTQVQKRSLLYDGKPCSVCGAKTRRTSAAKWWACERGHKLVRKNR